MKQTRFCVHRLGIYAMAALLLTMSAASADDLGIEVKRAGDVTYISGGVGDDQIRAIRAQVSSYSLQLIFTSHVGGRAAYTFPDQVTIDKADGTPVLKLQPDGPFLLVNLPVGKYRVTAVTGEVSKSEVIDIVAGDHKKATFDWTTNG